MALIPSSNFIRPEVLAPAGDYERLVAAVRYGADAVYLGAKQFGMRAAVGNFDLEELKRGVAYAHDHDVRVYLTCNTLPRNEEVDELPDFLLAVRDAGVDALIVADLGVMLLARRLVPEVELHVSTQTGVVNYLAARELYQLGAKRVVLARELSLEEIRTIRQNTPPDLELECFVHGAMCMSVSGRCLLSNYLTGRDANRGECAQPCRWSYRLVEEKRPGQFFPIFEDEGGSYILNAKDLCMIEHLDELIQAGATSLKIEGRAKSVYYVSVTTNAYRCAVDQYLSSPDHYALPSWVTAEVDKVSHRAYSTGFYYGRPEDGQCWQNGGYERPWEVAAVVEGWQDGMLLLTQRNRFYKGDCLEVLEPGKPPVELLVQELYDGEGTAIEVCPHPMMALRIPCSAEYPVGTMLRRQRNDKRTTD